MAANKGRAFTKSWSTQDVHERTRLVAASPGNPVEAAIWSSVRYLRGALSFWLFGALLVVLKIAQLLGNLSWFAVLSPFWFGNVVIACLQIKLVGKVIACFTGGGRIFSQDAYRRIQMSRRQIDQEVLPLSITEDLTHLVIRGTAGVIVSVPALLLLTISEVLLCAYLETGRPGLWCCASPVLVLQFVAVTQYALIKSGNWRSGAFHILGLFLTLSMVRRATLEDFDGNDLSSNLPPWPVMLLPLWALNALFLQLIIRVTWRHFFDNYELSAKQLLCCALYFVSTVVATAGEILLASEPCLDDDDVVTCLWLPLSTFYFGVFCGGVAVFIVIEVHAEMIIASKGFGEPLPLNLSKSDGFWEAAAEEQSFELSLGVFGSRVRRHSSMVELVGSDRAAAAAVGVPIVERSQGSKPRSHRVSSLGGLRGPPVTSSPQRVSIPSDYSAPPVQSDQYDSGCDSAAFNDPDLTDGGATNTAEESAPESS